MALTFLKFKIEYTYLNLKRLKNAAIDAVTKVFNNKKKEKKNEYEFST